MSVAAGGSLPISSTTSPSNAGLRGTLAIGFSPIPSTPEILLAVRGSYDRFMGNSPTRGIKSLYSAIGELQFYPSAESPQRWYLLLGAGIGHADQQFAKVTDPLGCIGVGAEISVKKRIRYQVELRLSDLSNSTYGDLRYLSLSVGLKF